MTGKKKVLVFGAGGLLGRTLVSEIDTVNYELVAVNHSEVDILDNSLVADLLQKHQPQVVMNCAGVIGVEYCESNPLEAWRVNAIGPGVIIKTLAQLGFNQTRFIHFSTSDVFDGMVGPYIESDQPSPINVYGWSKLGGEKITQHITRAENFSNVYIVRTGWLYGKQRNTFIDFVVDALKKQEEMIIADDQYNIPTSALDLSRASLALVEGNLQSGIYHFVNDADLAPSRFEIACFIAEVLSLDNRFLVTGKRNEIFTVPRPQSAVLVNRSDVLFPNWKESLADYLRSAYLS